jgi:hypothetical protein
MLLELRTKLEYANVSENIYTVLKRRYVYVFMVDSEFCVCASMRPCVRVCVWARARLLPYP